MTTLRGIIPLGVGPGAGWNTARERARFELVFGKVPSSAELERFRRCHEGVSLRLIARAAIGSATAWPGSRPPGGSRLPT